MTTQPPTGPEVSGLRKADRVARVLRTIAEKMLHGTEVADEDLRSTLDGWAGALHGAATLLAASEADRAAAGERNLRGWLVDRVRQSGRTQKEIAESIGITEKHMSQMMCHETGTIATWQRVLDALPDAPFATSGYGHCPKCGENKFVGHGPICGACLPATPPADDASTTGPSGLTEAEGSGRSLAAHFRPCPACGARVLMTYRTEADPIGRPAEHDCNPAADAQSGEPPTEDDDYCPRCGNYRPHGCLCAIPIEPRYTETEVAARVAAAETRARAEGAAEAGERIAQAERSNGCFAQGPSDYPYLCVRNKGHEGKHGYAGVFW